jgi:iron(III) transport system ATP-binding protein
VSPWPALWCWSRRFCCWTSRCPISTLACAAGSEPKSASLQQRLGFTAVYVTHDQDEALAVSDRIIVMKDGEIAQAGAPRDLYDLPASAFIADFMGEANVVACNVMEVGEGSALVNVQGLAHRVKGLDLRLGEAQLAVRPNAIVLKPRAGNSTFTGQITHSAYLGDHVEYEVKTDQGTLFVIDPSVDHALAPATHVEIGFKDRGVAVIRN